MDSSKILIQVLLVALLAIPAVILLLPTKGARALAIRRLTLLLVFVAGIVAIIFPGVTNAVANLVGVGRGADLLLYGLIIVFIGFALSSSAHQRRSDRQITALARRIALLTADEPKPQRDTEPTS